MLPLLVLGVNALLMFCVPLLCSLRKVLGDKRHPRSELVCVVAEHPLHAFELIRQGVDALYGEVDLGTQQRLLRTKSPGMLTRSTVSRIALGSNKSFCTLR